MADNAFAQRHPIHSAADVTKAVTAAKTTADKKHTHQRATALGHIHLIPTHWKKTDGTFNETSANDGDND